MVVVLMSSEGERELKPGEVEEFPYAIELAFGNTLCRNRVAKGGRHPILKQAALSWCMEKGNLRNQWFCQYVWTSPTTGYPVIRFKDAVDALMFRLVF